MTQLAPKQLISTQYIANTTTLYYTVPTATVTVVRRISMSNVTSAAETVTIYYVPSGDTPGASNKVLGDYQIDANSSVAPIVLEGIVLEAGDTIRMSASAANAIVVIGAGTEIS